MPWKRVMLLCRSSVAPMLAPRLGSRLLSRNSFRWGSVWIKCSDTGAWRDLAYPNAVRSPDDRQLPRRKEPLWYCCGPTVYDQCHLGHARTYVAIDILRRVLHRWGSTRTRFVMGVTDVDDKIIAAARRTPGTDTGLALKALRIARKWEAHFFRSLAQLGCLPPHGVSRVSEHMPEIQAVVRGVVAGGDGYCGAKRQASTETLSGPAGSKADEDPEAVATREGGAWFDVGGFQGRGGRYHGWGGGLGGAAGSRAGDIDKVQATDRALSSALSSAPRGASTGASASDFALWKRRDPEGGDSEPEPWWPAEEPLGAGRPGWHTECVANVRVAAAGGSPGGSAAAPREEPVLWIHSGGSDLAFPHHCNEAAQADSLDSGADGTPPSAPWAYCWHHPGPLRVSAEAGGSGVKMSKSLGNWVGVSDLVDSESSLWTGGLPGEDAGGRASWAAGRGILLGLAGADPEGPQRTGEGASGTTGGVEAGAERQGNALFGQAATDAFRALVLGTQYERAMVLSGRSVEAAAGRVTTWVKTLRQARRAAAAGWAVAQAPPLQGRGSDRTRGGAWPVHAGEQWLRPVDVGEATGAGYIRDGEDRSDAMAAAAKAAGAGSDSALERLVELAADEVDTRLRSGLDSPAALRAIDVLQGAVRGYLAARGGRDRLGEALIRVRSPLGEHNLRGSSGGCEQDGDPAPGDYEPPDPTARVPNPLVLWRAIEFVQTTMGDLGFVCLRADWGQAGGDGAGGGSSGWGGAAGWEEAGWHGGGAGLWTGDGPWAGMEGGDGGQKGPGDGQGGSGVAAGSVGGAAWVLRAAVRGSAVHGARGAGRAAKRAEKAAKAASAASDGASASPEQLLDAARALREASASLSAVLASCDEAREWGHQGGATGPPRLLPREVNGGDPVPDEPLEIGAESARQAAASAAHAAARRLRLASAGAGDAAEAAAEAAEAVAAALAASLKEGDNGRQ